MKICWSALEVIEWKADNLTSYSYNRESKLLTNKSSISVPDATVYFYNLHGYGYRLVQ